jgi:regulatory protein
MDLKAIQHYCAYQERCHSEVRHKLLELGFRGAELEEAIASLIADNFLNEERFARSYSSGKFRIKHWGKRKIAQALKQKQVSGYCISKGLQAIDETEYYHILSLLADKKWAEMKAEKTIWIRKQKVQRYLLQKGYEPELISEVLQEY